MASAKVSQNLSRTQSEAYGKKRKLSEESDSEFDYEPTVFLRCHCFKNDPHDSSTQIWEATFEPRSGKKEEPPLMATCGGNIVCLVNAKKGSVEKRYTDSNHLENFYCMAWTTLPAEDKGQVSILAVAGKLGYIVLLYHDKLICYSKTHAHEKDVNSLLFHPKQPSRLFSASYDKHINVWDIGKPKEQSKSIQRVLSINTNNFLLQLTYSVQFDAMLAAGENGLTVWSNVKDEKSPPTLGHMTFPRPIIDGLAIFNEHERFAVVKQSKSPFMDVFDLEAVMRELQKSQGKKNSVTEIAFKSCFQLEYCDIKCDYVYLTLQKNLLVCGDDEGSLWIYDTRKIPFESLRSCDKLGPERVLKWPAIRNPVLKHRKVVDEQKQVVVNAVAVAPDLSYIVAATSVNLVCLWQRSGS